MALTPRTWYFGWLGEMRPLLTPEVNLTNSDERIGGVHQAISGARTVDVTGMRRTYEMDWNYMTDAELAWLYAFYRRFITQPAYLIDPMKKNLLSQQASIMRMHRNNDLGIHQSSLMVSEYRNDFPSGLAITGDRVPIFVSSNPGAYIRFDGNDTYVPVFTGEPVTFSVYMRVDSGSINVSMIFDWVDKYGASLPTTNIVKNITTSWQRFSITVTPSGAQAGLRPAFVVDGGTMNLRMAAPQVEYASAPTAWEMGGGRAKVLIEDIQSQSPRYPLNNISVTLLEA